MQNYPTTYVPTTSISSKEKEDVNKFSASVIKSVLSFGLITMLFGVICSCITINRGTTYGSNLDISLGSISLVFLFIFLVLFFVVVAKFGSFQRMFKPLIDALSGRIFEVMGMKTIYSTPKPIKPTSEIELTSFPSTTYNVPTTTYNAYSDPFSNYS
jgi:hypothetical protein